MLFTHGNIRLFWKLFVRSCKESSHEKSKITDSPCESHKSRYFEIYHGVSKFVLHSLGPSNVKKPTQKCLALGHSYNKMLIKNPKYVLHSFYALETH